MCLQFGFVFFWQKAFGAKAAHKMLVKLTPGQNLDPVFNSICGCLFMLYICLCIKTNIRLGWKGLSGTNIGHWIRTPVNAIHVFVIGI
jgi:hypothetical protein